MEPATPLEIPQEASPSTFRTGGSRARRTFGAVAAGFIAIAILAGCLSDDQVTVQQQINISRAANHVAYVFDYSAADTKAQAWAEHLASQGSLSHSNLTDGYQYGTWCHLGENVGMGPSLASLQSAFMNSAPHRANILNSVFDHVGTGVAQKGGMYYVVQEFVDLC